MRKAFVLASFILVASCGDKTSENSDGSNATTYTSCSITSSSAILAADRAKDVSQCWDGVDYKEKSTAMNWCTEKVNSYIGQNYIFGHSIKYQIASTNCP